MIYISGKIAGLPIKEAKANFSKAKKILLKGGWKRQSIKNPFDFELEPKRKNETQEHFWRRAMLGDINILFDCEAIYMLKNWGYSRGARVEYAIAQAMGLKVYFEE